jgi:hypothetical protein
MRALLLCAIVCAVGCSKHSPNGAGLEEVRAALGKKWKADSLTNLDPSKFSAQKCVGGPLEGLDVVVCEYGSADASLRGKTAAENWVAQAVTGAALQNGRTVFAVADRGRVDPNGKLIHQMTSAYRDIK